MVCECRFVTQIVHILYCITGLTHRQFAWKHMCLIDYKVTIVGVHDAITVPHCRIIPTQPASSHIHTSGSAYRHTTFKSATTVITPKLSLYTQYTVIPSQFLQLNSICHGFQSNGWTVNEFLGSICSSVLTSLQFLDLTSLHTCIWEVRSRHLE